jgi:hypothetical protein
MEMPDFFASPPKAERAFLSPYRSETLHGKFGVRIETEPLLFINSELDRELEPEIILDHLSLPSIDPAELENTRYLPDSGYEGSFYFLAEHNWVDLKEIRFLKATGNSILAEYDLVIHLPKSPPNEYPITLRVQTQISNGESQATAPRSVDGLGTLVQDKKDSWKGVARYDGRDVEIELSADVESFDEIAAYARSIISEATLPRAKMDQEITDGLHFLAGKFQRFNVSSDFKADEFIPHRFYFYKRRHHDHPEVIIVLDHAADVGHWSLTFYNLDSGILNWVPKSERTR